MARFCASIQGNRGEATRTGSAASDMYGHVRGWGLGARVCMSAEGNDDICGVAITTGSNGHGPCPDVGFTVKKSGGSFFIRKAGEWVKL